MPSKDPERRREVNRQYYRRHAERIKERERDAWQRRRDQVNERRRSPAYRQRAAAQLREWRTRNRAKAYQHARTYEQRYPERVRRRRWAYWVRNKKQIMAKNNAYRRSRPEMRRMARQRYAEQNPTKMKVFSRVRNLRRQARLKNILVSFTPADWEAIVEEHGGRCFWCGRQDLPLQADHVIPVSKGGATRRDNIVPACRPCNSAKRNLDPDVWLLKINHQVSDQRPGDSQEESPCRQTARWSSHAA